jgi:hypothetical protein
MNSSIEPENKEEKLISLIIKSCGRSEETSLMQRYYFELMELEKFPLALTETLYNIITENSENNKFFSLNENGQKAFIIYLKNWFDKLKNQKESKKIKNVEKIILNFIRILFTGKISDNNKLDYEELLKNLFNLLKINKEMTTEKINLFIFNLINEIMQEVRSQNLTSLSNLRSFLALVEVLAFFQSGIVTSTKELIHYFEVLNIILNKFLEIYNLTRNYEDDEKSIKNRILVLNIITSVFCKISNKFLEIFKKDELLKYVSQQLRGDGSNFDEEKQNIFLKLNTPENDLIIKSSQSNIFFDSENFIIFIKKILSLNSDLIISCNIRENFQFSNSLFIINLSQIENLNNKESLNLEDIKFIINSPKSNLIEMLTLFSEYLTAANIYENFENFKFLCKSILIESTKSLGELIKGIYSNSNLGLQNIFVEKVDNKESEIVILKLLTRIIEFITISCQNSSGSNFLSENKIEIFLYIILPLLKIKPLEIDLFNSDPEEFVRNTSDMTSNQVTRLPKHKSVRLVDIMCMYIDSFLKFVTEFCLDLISYAINKNSPNKNFSYFVLNTQPIFNQTLLTFEDENLFEVSLQILSSISYLIYDKPKLRTIFEDKIESFNHILLNIQNEFIKSKLCNFYAYTLDDLFHNHKEVLSKSFDESFHFLFNCLLGKNESSSLNLMALESIQSLVFDDEMKIVVTPIVKIYIKDVLSLINDARFHELTSNALFHKFVKYLLNKFFDDLQDSVIYIFAYFWHDVRRELEIIINEEGRGSSKISKNFHPSSEYEMKENFAPKERNFKLLEQIHNIRNLINECCAKSQNMETKQKIYEEVLKILNYLDKFIDFEYEEDLLEIIILILNDIKLVPKEYSNSLFKFFDKLNLEVNFYLRIEDYHVDFIFSFLKNLRREDYMNYKEKVKFIIN